VVFKEPGQDAVPLRESGHDERQRKLHF
jgi:hypothetical protein